MNVQKNVATNQWRMRIFGIGLLLIGSIFILRLFHIQVLSHNIYASQAQQNHLKKFEINAPRGEIFVSQNGEFSPLVLNETRYILYGDPEFIDDKDETATKLAAITNSELNDYKTKLNQDSRYVVLERNVNSNIKNQIEAINLKGIGFQETSNRVYPEGDMGSHLIGFLNSNNEGQYGVEQYYNDLLKGKPGLLKTEVDARGLPIATASNTFVQPKPGNSILLTIDKNIQSQSHLVANKMLDSLSADSVSILVMDPKTGAVKAMTTAPEFNPAEYQSVEDYQKFINPVVSDSYEPGSIFKVFTMAAGLEEGDVHPQETYFDTGSVEVDGFTIRNAEDYKPQERSMIDVVESSLNTGSVYVLKELSGGNEINDKGKQKLYSYLTENFKFDQKTNIDLPQESSGSVDVPSERSDVGYANMSFGQGLSANMVQMASAVSSIANGGEYYQPYVLDAILDSDQSIAEKKEPLKNASNLLSKRTVNNITQMMERVVENGSGWRARKEGYKIAAKTGTAQVASSEGGYEENQYIGSMVGFPTEDPEYVLIVRVVKPQIYGYAGSDAAGQIFAEMNNWLLDYYMIPPSKDKD